MAEAQIKVTRDSIDFLDESGNVVKTITAGNPSGRAGDVYSFDDFDMTYFRVSSGNKLTMIYPNPANPYYYTPYTGMAGMSSRFGGKAISLNMNTLSLEDRNIKVRVFMGDHEKWAGVYAFDIKYYIDNHMTTHHCLCENPIPVCYSHQNGEDKPIFIAPYLGSGTTQPDFTYCCIQTNVSLVATEVTYETYPNTFKIIS